MKLLGHIAAFAISLSAGVVTAETISITVDGPDAIFLAGRTDLTVPDTSRPWNSGMIRHQYPTPEEAKEQIPPFIKVNAGDVIRVLDPAIGGINYFNGFGPGFFGPEGNGTSTASNISAFGGISGYLGPQGALTGVFLTDSIPSGSAPPTLSYPDGLDFTLLSPSIGQVFYIGDGSTSGGGFKEFVAPIGATRLFFGIPDGFGFVGRPGAYDDNDGSYTVRVGFNSIPTAAPEIVE